MKNKTKIYFFHPYSGYGGADLSISRLINGIDEKNFDIDFLSLNKAKIIKKINRKIRFKKISSQRTLFAFKQIINLIENDKRYKKKIFISNQYFANILTLIFLRKIQNLKIVIFERNHLSELSNYFGLKDFFKKKIIKLLIKNNYKKANLILTNSKESAEDLKRFVNANVLSIYNPCFFGLKKKKNKINKKINLINVGRFENQKNQITILNALKICRYREEFQVKLFGYGSKYFFLKRYIEKHNLTNVRLIQNIFDKEKIYAYADLYVGSSLFEGFPNVYVEAASYRLPIISSNFKSGSKEILLNGKGGTFFPIKDYKCLAKILDDFYLNKKKYLAKEIICSKNLKRFSNTKILGNFNKILKKLT